MKTQLFKFLIFVMIALSFQLQSQNYCNSNPVDVHGNLSVSGNRIVDESNQPVSFAGNSLFWSNTGWGAERFYNASVVSWLKEDWGSTIVRAAMGVEDDGGYLSDVSNKDRVKTIVEAAIAEGLYVIIDWHSHGAENYQNQAIEFFEEMASLYGNHPNVIYEIYNEPIYTSWSTIKSYAETVISAIRAIDSDNLIIVGTPTWSQDVDLASYDPITSSSNIAYTLHFYAGTHFESLRTKAQTALNNGIALMVTEWGTVNANGDGGVNASSTNEWMNFLSENHISHLNWSVNDKAEGASILNSGASSTGNWADSNLTESGSFVKSIVEEWSQYCDGATTSSFIPDPSKKYYIDVPVHNLRLAATGESEDAYTTSISTTGNTVEWQFVAKGNGSWHVQLAAGGSLSRLRTDNSEYADMQGTAWNGSYTYFDFTSGASNNTYFFTLPDGPTNYSRLQVNPLGNVKMVTSSHNGTWESFTITEVEDSSNIVHITKRNATGYALDGGNGGGNGQDVYLWSANQNNVNQQWIEIDRGNGYYSYQKMNTNYCIDGNNGGTNNQNVYLWTCANNNQNQHWQKVAIGDGSYRLVKRNASSFSLNGGSGGENGQSVNLYNTSTTSQNLNWYITSVGVSAKFFNNIKNNNVLIYPNPVKSSAVINGVLNSKINIYDINGKVVFSQKIEAENEELDLSSLLPGLYYVGVNGIKNTMIKIVKQ